MGLLNPIMLALGAAIAVPLVIHLFQRHQGPRVVFPAVRYLRRAETEHARRLKLRQVLLMLLRVAALAFVALAAARPFVRAGGVGHQPTAVAIVLDNSMSASLVVGDRRFLDRLKDLALESVAAAEAEDVFWLIRAGSPGEPAWPGDARATERRIRETEPSSASADLTAAVARARSVLAAGADGRAIEIHVLSDLQAGGLPAGGDSVAMPVIVFVPAERPPRNVAITAVTVGGGVPPIARQRSTVAVRVTGDSMMDSVNIRMAIGGRVVAAAAAPTGSSTILPFPAREPGYLAGWVEKDPDALRPDDRRYFATRVAPPPTVATTAPLGLVEEAIGVLERAGRIRRGGAGTADLAVLPAARGIEAAPPGQGLIVLPPDSILELPAVNRRLAAAAIPWRLEPSVRAGASRFATQDDADPPMRSLEQVQLRSAYRLLAESGAANDTVLLRLQGGEPWAVRGERPGGGRYVLLASPLSESASTLPTSPALVPLLDRLLGPWVAARPAIAEAEPGALLGLPPGTDAVVDPDGQAQPATGSYRVGSSPGVYAFLSGDSVVGMIAVNPPAMESDLAAADARRLRAAFPGASLHTAGRPGEWRDRIYRERVGREVGRWLAGVILLVLIVESVVAASGSRTRRRPDRVEAEPETAARRSGTVPAGG